MDAAISELVRWNWKESPPPANSVDLFSNAKKKAIEILDGADLVFNQNLESCEVMNYLALLNFLFFSNSLPLSSSWI